MNDFEHARLLATGIPGARLVPLDSDNHILLGDEPAWQVFVDEVRDVPGARRCPGPGRPTCCRRASARCVALVAEGRSNDEIAAELVPQRAHGRAAPAERLHEARRARPLGPGGRGGGAGAYVVGRSTRSEEWVVAPMPAASRGPYVSGHDSDTAHPDHIHPRRRRPQGQARGHVGDGRLPGRCDRGDRRRSARSLVAATGIGAGDHVLDIAAGSGNASIPPPRRAPTSWPATSLPT